MNRRRFIAALACLPFVGRLVKAETKREVAVEVDIDYASENYWPLCLFHSPPCAKYPTGDICLWLAERMPDGKYGYCKHHQFSRRSERRHDFEVKR